MFTIQRAVVLLMTAGAGVLAMVRPGPVDRVTPAGEVDPTQMYEKTQAEYYLSSEQLQWIRPGLHVDVERVALNANQKLVVWFHFTDDFGQPLDREGAITPGEVSFSFILSRWHAETSDYEAYTTRPQTSPITGDTAIQASSDSGGRLDDLGMGYARYTYGTAMPEGYDPSATHTVGIYAERDLEDVLEKTYYDNVEYDFRPDRGEVTEVWNSVADATCNACHEQLAFHGGSRRDVKLCVLCHNSGTVDPDTGNTVDMKVMIHKIHMGENLPSVEAGGTYEIIGYMQRSHDYSHVAFPQDVRNCTTCHKADVPQGHIWFTDPSRAACGSCHDDIVWETGENHPVPQFNDQSCSICHEPQGEREFDVSIMGAHVVPTKSEQLAGLNLEFLDVADAFPGGHPTVTFRVTNGDGSWVDPSSLDRFSILAGGPTTDYEGYMRQTVSDPIISGDVAMFTFPDPLPEDAMGTWGFSADCYRFVTIDDGSADGLEVREAAFNPLYYAAVTDTEPMPRREVVDLDKCNVCHDTLALHGGQRYRIEECVICHNANETDESVRPAEANPPESVHFKWMIHRIHTGAELEDPFIVYGHGGSVNDYSHVGFPGDLRSCGMCHDSGTYELPLPDGLLPTDTAEERDFIGPMLPATAACLSCHDSVAAAAHAYTQTAPFGEGCASCHGSEREFSVDMVHAH